MIELPKTPSFRLEGKRALVTGAGRGIGLAAAAALAEYGAHVVLVARTGGEVAAVAEAIRAAGGRAEAHALDVTDVAAARAFVETQQPFHVLVNNAGTNKPQPFLDVDTTAYDAVVNLNVRAAYFMAQAVARGMAAAGIKGSLIHISSQMAFVAGPSRTVYCATKSAMEGFSRAIAVELAEKGIRSNTIAPTFVETPMAAAFMANKTMLDHVLAKIKLGRVGQVEDLMGAVLYLASDASAMMTGTSMLIDGGWTAD